MNVTEMLSRTAGRRKLSAALQNRARLLALALAIIVALALGLRLYGLNWDRGYSYTPHPDERFILSKVSELSLPSLGELGLLFDADESPLNPRRFSYGSFPLYLLKGVQLAYSAWPGTELHDLRLAGRTISALADVGTVIVVYLLGSRLYGRREGLLASLLASLAVIHIQMSHFFAVDTLLTLFTIVALYFMFRVAVEGRARDSILAGAFIGLGMATKVSQAPIYLALFMAHLLFVFSVARSYHTNGGRELGERLRMAAKGLGAAVGASLLVFIVVQPYALLDWSRFFDDFIEQSEMVRRIRDYPYTRQYIDTTPYWYHIRQLATWGLGWPLGIVVWAGLLYGSLRGMRIGSGLGYLALGWGLPIAVLLFSTSFIGIFLASGIAFAALAASLPFRSADSRMGVLLLAWVVPYLLITGALQVKFLRYLLPITPVLLLFGSRMLIALWDGVTPHRSALRPWLGAGLLLLVGTTGFYAFSYMAVYGEPHTAVRTSRWINENVPKGSVILKEHWEEGLPDMQEYSYGAREVELTLYDDDGPAKDGRVAEQLAGADYIALFSNRLYGTIPRLPERYPATTEYYRLLFSGALGYQIANVETAYPRLAGVSFVHDTFGRLDIPRPPAVGASEPSGLALSLGFADESFSVYDHPVGLLLQNVARYDAETIRRTIEDAVPETALARPTPSTPPIGLLMSPEDAEAQRRGGTWSEIVRDNSWTGRFPVLGWLLVLEIVAVLALPVTFLLFRSLSDRGYLFAKPLGLLLVSLVVWLLASAHWMAFSRASIGLALVLLGSVSAVALVMRRRELVDFVRARWPIILTGEVIFLVAFFSFVVVRMANPDLWHPWRGGEKPMDLAYLNAVLRSTYMPPYDPWFSGGYLNYYYWGQFMVATLIKATGINPAVAFNLAVPAFFAMTVGGAFTVVYNLAEGTRRSIGTGTLLQGGGRGERWSPVLAGIGGAMFVTVLGNLDGAIQIGRGVWRTMFAGAPFGQIDFWRSSRMMPPDPPGWEITEFPFFTFLFADLHAHLMAIPFTLLALGLALALVVGARRVGVGQGDALAGLAQRGWSLGELARVATLGVVVGSLVLINAWDFPTYLIVSVAALFLAAYFRNGGLSMSVLLESGVKSALVLLVGYLVFLPFHLNSEAFFTSLESTTNQTVLWQFLAISGLFIFIVGSFFLGELREWLPWRRIFRRRVVVLTEVSSQDRDALVSDDGMQPIGVLPGWVITLAVTLAGVAVLVISSRWLGSTIPFLIVVMAIVVIGGLRFLLSWKADAPQLTFVAVTVMVALGLAVGLDIFRLEGDVDRMNSVFKFYLQIWVLLALASAYLLWRLAYGRKVPLWRLWWGKKVWLVALLVLILSASIYPVLGTQDRLRDRFDVLPLTLDGTAYMRDTLYTYRDLRIDLSTDLDGIRWLKENIAGSPVVLEATSPTAYRYRWNGRVSVYTGLPSVVGWQVHQEQQRQGYAWAVGDRINDVDRIYKTTDALEALALLRKYGVEYIYLGQLERQYYPGAGLDKFEGELREQLESVYRNGSVTIYRVRQG